VILDMTFTNEPPRQLQDVRLVSVYLDWDEDNSPMIAVHFNKYESGMETWDLSLIKSMQFTND